MILKKEIYKYKSKKFEIETIQNEQSIKGEYTIFKVRDTTNNIELKYSVANYLLEDKKFTYDDLCSHFLKDTIKSLFNMYRKLTKENENE